MEYVFKENNKIVSSFTLLGRALTLGNDDFLELFLQNMEIFVYSDHIKNYIHSNDNKRYGFIDSFNIRKEHRTLSNEEYYDRKLSSKTHLIESTHLEVFKIRFTRLNTSHKIEIKKNKHQKELSLPMKNIGLTFIQRKDNARKRKLLEEIKMFKDTLIILNTEFPVNSDMKFNISDEQINYISKLFKYDHRNINKKLYFRIESVLLPTSLVNPATTEIIYFRSNDLGERFPTIINNKLEPIIGWINPKVKEFEELKSFNATINLTLTESNVNGHCSRYIELTDIRQLSSFDIVLLDQNLELVNFKNSKIPINIHLRLGYV